MEVVMEIPKDLATYAAYSLNDEVLYSSSSGGLFYEFATHILSINGVVYGVAMNESKKQAVYKRVSDIDNIEPLMGSKYMQTKMGNTFSNVKTDLDNNKFVLFSGTGCIINGLKMFLKREYPNLFCIEVICHGVPSPLIWKKYFAYIENKNNGKISSVNFRFKNKPELNQKHDQESKVSLYSFRDDPYMRLFLKDLSLRPSCYACQAKINRSSDIIIGDFWGIDDVSPRFKNNKGTSLVIIRTSLGKKMFDAIGKKIKKERVSYNAAIKKNSALINSVNKPKNREAFFHDAIIMPFYALYNKYSNTSFKKKIKLLILRSPLKRSFISKHYTIDWENFAMKIDIKKK